MTSHVQKGCMQTRADRDMSRELIRGSNYPGGEPVRPDTVLYFRSLRVGELEIALGKMLERIEGGLGRVDAELRNQLFCPP
jgi:hypothetical protein